jgi:hypothetical protein
LPGKPHKFEEQTMNNVNKTSRILGFAFLLQFITSFSSGVFLQSALIVADNVSESMIKIANNAGLLRIFILVEMLTALGVIFLGSMLFITLRKQNEKMALTALGFYILEGAIIATSKLDAFSLLRISQEYATTGQPVNLLAMANLALASVDNGLLLLMLAFCPGAILFYYLLYKSRLVPRWLSLWGLMTTFPLLIGTVLAILGYEVSMLVYLPYLPFEFVIGLWILIKGIQEEQA